MVPNYFRFYLKFFGGNWVPKNLWKMVNLLISHLIETNKTPLTKPIKQNEIKILKNNFKKGPTVCIQVGLNLRRVKNLPAEFAHGQIVAYSFIRSRQPSPIQTAWCSLLKKNSGVSSAVSTMPSCACLSSAWCLRLETGRAGQQCLPYLNLHTSK